MSDDDVLTSSEERFWHFKQLELLNKAETGHGKQTHTHTKGSLEDMDLAKWSFFPHSCDHQRTISGKSVCPGGRHWLGWELGGADGADVTGKYTLCKQYNTNIYVFRGIWLISHTDWLPSLSTQSCRRSGNTRKSMSIFISFSAFVALMPFLHQSHWDKLHTFTLTSTSRLVPGHLLAIWYHTDISIRAKKKKNPIMLKRVINYINVHLNESFLQLNLDINKPVTAAVSQYNKDSFSQQRCLMWPSKMNFTIN